MKNSILFICLNFLMACAQNKPDIDFYIISEHEYRPGSANDSIPLPPPPPPPPANLAWYSDLVLIFDTNDIVYLYQTECNLEKFNSHLIRYNEPAPHFIGLTPDHLVTLRSDYVKEFLLDNSDYFMLDTNNTRSTRLLYLVSVSDTIKNRSFYEIRDMVKIHRRTNGAIFTMIRRTTEEENHVLFCKRSNTNYHPKDYVWSTNFLDGHTMPFTSRYDSLANRMDFVVYARQTFRPDMTLIRKPEAPK